jgi:hypothetical protein
MAPRRSRSKVHNQPSDANARGRAVTARQPESFEVSTEEQLRALGSRAASTIAAGTAGLSVPLPVLPAMGDAGTRVNAELIERYLPDVLAAVMLVDERADREASLREILRNAMRWAAGVRRDRPEQGRAERLAGPLYLLALRRFQREASGEERDQVWPPKMTGRAALLARSASSESFEEDEAEPKTRHLRDHLYETYEEFGPPPARVYDVLKKHGPRAAAREYAAAALGISSSKVRDILKRGEGVWWSGRPSSHAPVRKLSKP